MKKSNLALTLLMAFGITACGSSGGGSPKVNVPKFEKPTTEQPAQKQDDTPAIQGDQSYSLIDPANPANAIHTTPYTKNNELVGGGYALPINGILEPIEVTNGKKEQFNLLNVEGKTIELVPTLNAQEGQEGKVVKIESTNKMHFGSRGKYTVAGFAWEEGLNNQYLLALGTDATNPKDMPVNGSITYKGHGSSSYSSDGNRLDRVLLTDVDLVANFDNKTLTGSITTSENAPKFVPVNISADITQNTFYGYANNVEVKGGFFGPQAAEVAGDYNAKSSVGVFQAEKQ